MLCGLLLSFWLYLNLFGLLLLHFGFFFLGLLFVFILFFLLLVLVVALLFFLLFFLLVLSGSLSIILFDGLKDWVHSNKSVKAQFACNRVLMIKFAIEGLLLFDL